MDIKIRSLSMLEYDEFQDYVESFDNEKDKATKQIRKFAIWIGEKIYGLDPKDNSISVATFMKVFNDTMELTNKTNDEEIKNLKASGNGVSVAE